MDSNSLKTKQNVSSKNFAEKRMKSKKHLIFRLLFLAMFAQLN